MSKKIVVITGSPRKDGNTFRMAEAFVKAAEEKGNPVTRFDAAFLDVGGCKSCGSCYQGGKPCCFGDDFNKVAPAIIDADVVVFAMPVYWYSLPAKMKAVLDKFMAFRVGGKDISGKECALLSCCEEHAMSMFDGVRITIERTAELLGWKMIGEVCIPEVLMPGDIEKTDGCEKAAELGASIR